jgi:hypothetical protein
MQPNPEPVPDDERSAIEVEAVIRSVVVRLARPHRSGGHVIERAAILAEGRSSAAVLDWIAEHDGEPEARAPRAVAGGLHGARSAPGAPPPLRYVLPPGALPG